MKFFRLDLLTLLISLFILSSCKNKDTVGLPVDASQQVTGTQLTTSNLTVNTTAIDSILTSGLVKTPLAYFKDASLGTTEANIAAGLNLPGGVAYSLPAGTVTTDSAVLVLRYTDGFYGDSLNSNYKINVYQLAEQPLAAASASYYSNKVWSFNSALIGSRSFKPYTHTVFKVTNIVKGKPDTLIKVPAQLRVPISNAFITNNFFTAPLSQLSTPAEFQLAVKGLYLTLDKGQSGDGGNIMFNLDSSRIDVYYKAVNGTTIDTAVVSLPVTASAHAAQIKHTYTAAVQTALSNKASNNLFYIQGLGGLKTKITFPKASVLFGSVNPNNIVLNRAELIITPNPGSGIPYVPQPKLGIYRNDIASQPLPLPDGTANTTYFLSSGIFDGYYSATLQSYHFIITGYMQSLLRGTLVDYGTYISAVDTTNKSTTTSPDYLPSAQTAGRAVLVGTGNTGAYNIKLNIVYTKINQ